MLQSMGSQRVGHDWATEQHTRGKVNSLVNETLKKAVNHAPLTEGKVQSLVNETLLKLLNHAALTHGKVNSLLKETLM